uniref:Coat protein n=1 Tax=Cymbidium mosaic virus TaxID=12178 RepID=A0A4P9D7K2_9VIRU|nr:coat protein [Cymbidium mosaic virus]
MALGDLGNVGDEVAVLDTLTGKGAVLPDRVRSTFTVSRTALPFSRLQRSGGIDGIEEVKGGKPGILLETSLGPVGGRIVGGQHQIPHHFCVVSAKLAGGDVGHEDLRSKSGTTDIRFRRAETEQGSTLGCPDVSVGAGQVNGRSTYCVGGEAKVVNPQLGYGLDFFGSGDGGGDR